VNLHTLEVPADEDDEETPFDGSCPHCGGNTWERNESGWKTERHTIRFPGAHEDWDVQEESVDEHGSWECYSCGHVADQDEHDWIEDHR
jgi:hypothetical protein